MGIFSKKKEDKKVIAEKSEKVDVQEIKETEKPKEKKSENKPAKKISENKCILAEKTIIRPWISEKASNMMSSGVYTFSVSAGASKNSVKDVIESLFSVNVKSVNIVNIHGKLKNFKGKSAHRSDRKKAIATLKEGQKIEELAI